MQQHQRLALQQRPALLGRLKMAAWIGMKEPEFARAVEALEKDPLFMKLYRGPGMGGAIARQPWPGGGFSRRFFELNEAVASGGDPVDVEKMVGERGDLMPKIRKLGQEAFERYFIFGEEAATLLEISERTGLSLEDVEAIHEFVLELGSKTEFFRLGKEPGKGFTCLARLEIEEGRPGFQFLAPYWARGRYRVRYDAVERIKREGSLEPDERRRLRHLLKKIETLNLRQNTLYRILETSTRLQVDYLRTGNEADLRPVSLRALARRLDLAPSTVSRALHGRSVELPNGEEKPLALLTPGRRRVLREVLAQWLEAPGMRPTDAALAERLRLEFRIRVSRRTVNAVRHDLRSAPKRRKSR